jgi:hypothetical protein
LCNLILNFVSFLDFWLCEMVPKIDEPTRLAQFASGSGLGSGRYPSVFVSRDTPNLDEITLAVQDVGIHSLTVRLSTASCLG